MVDNAIYENKITLNYYMVFLITICLVFQSALSEYISGFFSYLDEIVGLLGIVLFFVRGLRTNRLVMKKRSFNKWLPIVGFICVGLLGNFIFQYQKTGLVIQDLYTNLKFFLTILTGYELFKHINYNIYCKKYAKYYRFISYILFALTIFDLVTHYFPIQDMRYGMRCEQLFYEHSTYMAASMLFLISLLTAFYEKKNNYAIAVLGLCILTTLRSKAIGGVVLFYILFWLIIVNKTKLKWWHYLIIGFGGLYIAWGQLSFYYIGLKGLSARSVMTQTSFQILLDYFPIGTGFGTYASHSASVNYSPVYVKYGFESFYELRNSAIGTFFDDTFWPIIIGQTGFIGLLLYIYLLRNVYKLVKDLSNKYIYFYCAGLFIFGYLIVSSTSEPAFNNSIAVPFALLLGAMTTLNGKEMRRI